MTRHASLLAGISAAAALIVFGPGQLHSLPDVCLFQIAAGWECPGCGMLRALAALGSGEVRAAISYNWKALVVAPLLVSALVQRGLRASRHLRPTDTAT